MKRWSGLVLGAVLTAGVSAASAQTPATPGTPAALADTAARVRERALSGSGAYDILESLTTETGPRPAGSPAFARAKDWAIAKMTALGFQNVHAEPFTILAWFKGAETAEVTAPFPQPLVITGLGRSVSTPPEGVEAEIAIFKTFEELQAAPANSLTGKIAVLTERMGANDSTTGYGAANRWRRKGPVEAGKRGAVGFLIRIAGDQPRPPAPFRRAQLRRRSAQDPVRRPVRRRRRPDRAHRQARQADPHPLHPAPDHRASRHHLERGRRDSWPG